MTTRHTPAFLTRSALGITLGVAVIKGLSPFAEPDLWWHLRTGRRLLDGAGLVATDPSARFADHPYVATQWLPEGFAAWVYSWSGIGGILWLRSAMVLGLVVATFVCCRRLAGKLPSAVAAGLTLIGAGGGLNPRPQLVSFVLFAVTVYCLLGVARDRRPCWTLVPVFWLWACSHGLWTFGLALMALVLVALVADPRTRPARRDALLLGGWWIACLVAVALTPLGPRVLWTPFEVAGHAASVAEEWRPTPFNNVFTWAAAFALLVVVIVWARHPTTRPWWQVAMLAFAAFCTFWMWRLVPLGAVCVAPLFAGALGTTMTGRSREPATRGERRSLLAVSAGLLVLAAVVCALPSAQTRSLFPQDPASIDHALDQVPAGSVVLNDFAASGWLLWRHPGLVPVADLRGEIYDLDYLRGYESAMLAEPGWRDFVARTGPDAALLDPDSAIAGALERRLGWQVAARTDQFVVLRPTR